MFWLEFFLLFILSTLVLGQSTHIVQIGADGTFYDPSTVAAIAGDIVQFVFEGADHEVVQSNSTNPCSPLPGGFSSGIAGIGTDGTTADRKVWNLIVTDDTKPIWFFCALTRPASHCATGMVGVINPPNISAYGDVKALAKAVSGTPKPSIFVALSGIGAFATNSPVPISDSGTPISIDGGPLPSDSIPSATPTTHPALSAKQKLGVILGATIGGIVLIAAIVAAVFLRKIRRRQMQEDEVIENFFDYRASQAGPVSALVPNRLEQRPPKYTATATTGSTISSGYPGASRQSDYY